MADGDRMKIHAEKLGIELSVSAVELERAFMRKTSSARMNGESDRVAEFKEAFEALQPWVAAREKAAAQAAAATARQRKEEMDWQKLADAEEEDEAPPSPLTWDLRSFDSLWISLIIPPVVVGIAWLVNMSPLQFFLRAFYIWIHEFGHATVAWMSGYKALPLPLGWANISQTKQDFVYWGVLFLLSVFFWAGWKERKLWPLILAPAIAVAQWWMTWRVPEWRIEMWIDWAGVGGEFYLSAAMVCLFFVSLPDKFRWGGCRYLFLFLGAGCFIESFTFWRDVYVGLEEIPWGTMLHGEHDEGGDMNKLRDGWGWTRQRIYRSYNSLGQACLIAIGIVYTLANLLNLLKLKGSGRDK